MEENQKQRVVLVCPQGRAVAHMLRQQLQKNFPSIEVVGTYSINQLSSNAAPYDLIISTMDIPHLNNVIKVDPFLSVRDIKYLQEVLRPSQNFEDQLDLKILELVKKYATVHDEQKLQIELQELLKPKERKERYQPMLNEVINIDRIQVIDEISDWKEAIKLASEPLLNEGTIDEDYVSAMIGGVEKYGPYIVLADEFALPHASNQGGVKEIAISVLVTKKPVDLLGQAVKVFMVLATIDNQSHLKALASLTEVIGDDDLLAAIKDGTKEEILKILEGGE